MVFMILSVVIFFIVNDTNSTAEAKYPIYSLISSIICLSEVSEPYLYNLIPNSFINLTALVRDKKGFHHQENLESKNNNLLAILRRKMLFD
jgi:hypothetical protein